jgi:hypothetical protein
MAIILKTSINLSDIPKDKIIEGKKGKYLPITITLNNEKDKFGNDGPVIVEQSMEERQNKEAKVYLGNAKVVWTDGVVPQPTPREGQPQPQQQSAPVAGDDLPF